MSDKTRFRRPEQAPPELSREFRDADQDENGRSARVRHVIDRVGGIAKMAQLSGIGLRTLTRYQAGEPMKVASAVALAKAADVHLDWLLTGEGPMARGAAEGQAPGPAAPWPQLDDWDLGNLVWALELVEDLAENRASAPARVRAMLAAAREMRSRIRMPQLPEVHEDVLARCLDFVEGQDPEAKLTAHQRLHFALQLYHHYETTLAPILKGA